MIAKNKLRSATETQISISLPKEFVKRLQERAVAREQSLSGYIRYAARREMLEPLEYFPPLKDRAVKNSTEPKHSP